MLTKEWSDNLEDSTGMFILPDSSQSMIGMLRCV
jgi:hypothetical protein